MESAICLSHCPFPYGSKEFQGASPSRFHLRFNHATPLCFLQVSTTRYPVTRSVRPLNFCMLERFPEPFQNEGSGNKILRGVTGVSLVVAFVFGLFNFSGKMNPKLTTAYAFPKFSENGAPMFEGGVDKSVIEAPGRSALESLLDIKRDTESKTDRNEFPTKFSDPGPDRNEVYTLKLVAIGHSESEKRIKALKILEEQYDKCKKNNPEAEKFLAVALVEVSMFQENFDEARKRLDKQIDEELELQNNKGSTLTPEQKCHKLLTLYNDNDVNKIGIAQLILYKAIVHTAMEDNKGKWRKSYNKEEAAEWRKLYMKIFKS